MYTAKCEQSYTAANATPQVIDTTCSQLLSSHVATERYNVKAAISVSRKLEDQFGGDGKRSINQKVAKEALKIAKIQHGYALQQYKSSMEHAALMEEWAQMKQQQHQHTHTTGYF